jgi:progressive ankylosis protein
VRYGALLRFFWPLVLTQLALGVGSQFLSGGMARMPHAAQTLASFGLAWGLTDFLVSPLSQVRQLGLVLAADRAALHRLRLFVLVCSSGLVLLLFALAETALGDWVIGDLHGVDLALEREARWVLLLFMPLPLFEGMYRLYSGVLIQMRRTDLVSMAMLAGIGVQIVAVFWLLEAEWVERNPVLLPVIAVYLGTVVGLAVVLWGYWHCAAESFRHPPEAVELGFAYIARFFWPLALVMAIQGMSRPLVNLFVSHQSDGALALAALAVVYPLAHLPYGWVNELRSLPAAFSKEKIMPQIRRFSAACGLLSFLCMALLFWTPLRDIVLLEYIAIDADLARLCVAPLFVFSFFPLAVALRSYFNGVALVQHRTRALAPSAPARIISIFIALLIFSQWQWAGATMGVAALLCGFVVEALSVWLGVRIWPRWRSAHAAQKLAKENF